MAHYAYLDENNIVTQVIVGKDENEGGIDWELRYGNYKGQTCKRTSYNTQGGIHYDPITGEPSLDQSKAFRKNLANIGDLYDEQRDAFIAPKPFDSWELDEETCLWKPPTPYPTDGNNYQWNEDDQTWDLIS